MKFSTFGKIAALSLVLIAGGCKLKNPTDDVRIKVDTDQLLPYQFSVQFVDKATGSTIDDKQLSIEIGGKDAAKIYEISGNRTFEVVGGMINLAVTKANIPSEETPLDFTITCSGEGYLASTIRFYLTDPQSQSYDIDMVSLGNLPAGITKGTTSISNNTDGLASDVTINPAKASTLNTGMSLTIPAGTKFLDANGNVISGNFTATVYYFSPESESLQYTPQGDENGEITVAYKDGKKATYLSSDPGVAYIEISNGSGFVASFSKPASITMDVHKEIMNFETQTEVKAGDSLEFIARGISAGDWNFQQNAKIVDLGGEHFSVSGETTKAYWVKPSIGGQGRSLGKKASTCYMKFGFKQSSTTCPSTFRLTNLTWKRANGTSNIIGVSLPSFVSSFIIPSNTTGGIAIVPVSSTIKNLYNPRISALVTNLRTPGVAGTTSVTPTSGCAQNGPYAYAPILNYQLPNCSPINLTVSLNCPNISVTSIPPIFYRLKSAPANSAWLPLVAIKKTAVSGQSFSGSYDVYGLSVGQTYTFKTTYKNKEYKDDVTATSTNMLYNPAINQADCP